MTTDQPGTGRIAEGATGARLARRIYRRSPARWLHNVWWDHRGLQPTDVMLSSYPRSGSTWTRFLLYAVIHDGTPDFRNVTRDVPLVGKHAAASSALPDGGRLIKTHEPYMRRYRRVVHIVRDPRDMAISYWYFMLRIGKIRPAPDDDMAASFNAFIDALIAGRIDGFTNWHSHVWSYLRAAEKHPDAICRIRFEDLRADTAGTLQHVGTFLGLNITADQAHTAVERASIERMREAEEFSVATESSRFAIQGRTTGLRVVRSGEVGGYKAQMTDDQVAKFRKFAKGMLAMGYELE